jgi:hypothetical protein
MMAQQEELFIDHKLDIVDKVEIVFERYYYSQ